MIPGDDAEGSRSQGPRGGGLGALLRLVDQRPLVVVAALGAIVAVVHLVWLAANRPIGTWNPDEAGYLGNALRFQRAFTDGVVDSTPSLGPLLDRVGDTTTAPLIPLLSVPFLLIGSRTIGWAMVVQPLFHLISAVAVAGIVARLGSPRRSVVAGIVVLGLPGAILAGRSYVFAGGTTAALCLSVWALLASDRGQRRWPMVGFGLAVGAMVLSRTMAVAFVPALALGALVWFERSRAMWRNVALAVAAALLVASPWWLAAGDRILDYLVGYGYTDLADPYGSASFAGRVANRLGSSILDVRPLLLVPALVVVALAAVKVVGEVRVRGARSVLDAHRAHVAVWAVIVGGYLALLTSANSGIWFALPLEVLGVGAVVALAPALAPSPRRVAGTVVVAVALLNLVAVGNWPVGARHAFDAGEQQGSLAAVLFGDMYQPPTGLRTNDPLLLSERNDREAVGAQWWAAHARVADAIEAERSGDGLVHQTVTGSGQLMNANSIDLAQELSQRPATSWDAVDSTASDLSPWLTPSVGRSPRVLVVIELDSGVFPIDEQWREVVDEAVAQGWTETARVPLPDGGSVSVLSHPDAGPG